MKSVLVFVVAFAAIFFLIAEAKRKGGRSDDDHSDYEVTVLFLQDTQYFATSLIII